MAISSGNDILTSPPTLGRWLRAFLGLVMILSAATQVAAVQVAHADAGPVLSLTADLPGQPCGSGEPRCPADKCVTSACHGFWFVAGPASDLIVWAGAPAILDHDRSIAGNVVLPPLHPPKNSPRV